MSLLEVRDLHVRFSTPAGTVYAVNGITYSLDEGETLAMIGESASGKSVHALAMLGILPRTSSYTRIGQVIFDGRNLLTLNGAEMRAILGKQIGFVFQDPMSSLNPVLTIGHQVADVLRAHLGMNAGQARTRAAELLETVKIKEPQRCPTTLPSYSEMSGPPRQST
jgi:ABC-type microcin C transport system duplicated ATPase subunit YejF